MVFRTLLLIFLLIPMGAVAGDEDVAAEKYFLPTPEEWRTETIPFPLEFAPELEYDGVEELRFAPGMFKAESKDFWTYAFIWWIADQSSLDPEDLAKDLEFYFAGLTRAVAEDRGFDSSGATHDVKIAVATKTTEPEIDFVGTAKIFDPFVTRDTVSLNFRIQQIRCPDQERLAVVFELSPQPFTHTVWLTLTGIREGFRCSK